MESKHLEFFLYQNELFFFSPHPGHSLRGWQWPYSLSLLILIILHSLILTVLKEGRPSHFLGHLFHKIIPEKLF